MSERLEQQAKVETLAQMAEKLLYDTEKRLGAINPKFREGWKAGYIAKGLENGGNAQQQLEEANKSAEQLNSAYHVTEELKQELEGRLQRIRKQWTQKLHEIKKAMIPHADICRKCPLRKTVCSKQQKAHPSFGCNAIKNLGEAYHVLCEFERELAVLPEEVEK